MVEVAIPGERWEIEFFANGNVEVEKFISNAEILDEEELENLFVYCCEYNHSLKEDNTTSNSSSVKSNYNNLKLLWYHGTENEWKRALNYYDVMLI